MNAADAYAERDARRGDRPSLQARVAAVVLSVALYAALAYSFIATLDTVTLLALAAVCFVASAVIRHRGL